MAACALVHKVGILAIGIQIHAAPAAPAPTVSGLVVRGVLQHQFYLHELAGMHESICTGFLLPEMLPDCAA